MPRLCERMAQYTQHTCLYIADIRRARGDQRILHFSEDGGKLFIYLLDRSRRVELLVLDQFAHACVHFLIGEDLLLRFKDLGAAV